MTVSTIAHTVYLRKLFLGKACIVTTIIIVAFLFDVQLNPTILAVVFLRYYPQIDQANYSIAPVAEARSS